MKTRSASEWREFWRTRGERELEALLDEYAERVLGWFEAA